MTKSRRVSTNDSTTGIVELFWRENATSNWQMAFIGHSVSSDSEARKFAQEKFIAGTQFKTSANQNLGIV